jgi:DNA-binding SARP family transcriptional activator
MATEGPPPILDIRLLGAPVVLVRGRPLDVDTRKAVAILALLAADGRAYAREELAALLWPDADDPSARGALRRTLSTLRAAVGDEALAVDRARVALVEAVARSDVQELERRASAGSLDDLRAIADLARGPFLAGFSLRDSPDFDDWRAARAVTIERSILAALDRLGAALAAAGDLPGAIRATERRLDLDPLDEAAHARLMDLFAARGDRSAALRQFRACVAILDRELGVEPLATTTARYQAIRDGEVAVAATPLAPPTAAPAPGPGGRSGPLPLVGRDDALAALVDALGAPRDGSGRVVAVHGEAGIGKSRLVETALAAVRSMGGTVIAAAAFPAERAIAYGAIVDLLRAALADPVAAARLMALPDAMRVELGRLLPALHPDGRPTEPGPSSPGAHARLVAAVADGLTAAVAGAIPGVVWLDDVQWLDDASRETLDFLLRRLADRPIALVLTWRPEDLDPDGMAFAARVAGTGRATDLGLGRLDRVAVETLVAAAGHDAPATVDGIADRLFAASEGLPLYVVEVLAGPGPTDPETLPAGVGAVLRDRLAGVAETTSQVLAAASVIGRSFDLATLRHASGRSEDEVVDATDEALRRGLVRETGDGLDFVHGALRDLVYEGTSLTRRRLLHRRVAEALRLDLPGSGRDDLARLVLVATHERAAGREAAAADAHRVAGERAAEIHANRAALDQYEAALALGGDDPAGLHEAIGRLRTRVGDYAGAVAALEAAAAIAEPPDVPRLEWALARAHLRRGDLVAAGHHLDAASAGTREAALTARVAVDRSALARRRGDPAAAAAAAHAAVEAASAAGDARTLGAARRMLGLAALDAGDATAAVIDLQAALAAAAEDPDPTAAIAAGVGLAMAEAALGDVDAAVARGQTAVEACRRIGDRHLEAAVENHLADLLHAAGREEAALEHLRRAVAAFAELGGDPADPDPGIWMLAAS